METDIVMRMANKEDAEEILKIYAPYVTDTAVSFEYDVPSVQVFAERITDIAKKYPFIVAVENNCILGYAYASAFKERAAYDWAVETTVYLRQDCRGKGIGKKLYLALEEILRKQNILNLNACIAYTPTEDVYLTDASIHFHNQLGYKKVGHFAKCGYKFETWYDMIWMEKMIGEHSFNPKPVIPIRDLHGLFNGV